MTFDDQKEKDMAEIRENFKTMQENLEKTWAITQENAKMAAKNAKALDKATEAIKNNIKDTENWRVKSKNFVRGSIDNERGDFVEAIARANLVRLLRGHGVNILRVHSNIKDEGHSKYEVDAIAINGEEVVFVETKTTLSVHKVKRFIEKTLLRIREEFPEYKDRKIYGAVAFLQSKKDKDPRKDENVGLEAAQYALEQGLFVISVAGDSAHMLNDKSFQTESVLNFFSKHRYSKL